MNQSDNLKSEWSILHGNIETYEKYSLIIKLVSVLAAVLSVALEINKWVALIFIMVLWLQSGIWKTFQQRLEERIRYLENLMRNATNEDDKAFQLYTQWIQARLGVADLIKEYLINSLKPTVAYPYIALILTMVIAYLFVR